MTYATDRIHREVAYLARYLHWSFEDILDLEHEDRRVYVDAAAALVTAENQR